MTIYDLTFKILDAGCGTGNATRALHTIAREKRYANVTFYAFDLTQAMLDLFRQWIRKVQAGNITLKQADVADLKQLPPDWNGYDLIIASAMLEYVPRDTVRQALRDLKRLLNHDGRLAVFITKRNIVTRLCIERWWKTNTYSQKELQEIFLDAGLGEFKIVKFWWNAMFAIEAKGEKLRPSTRSSL